jgi:6-phosphogluconolactonase
MKFVVYPDREALSAGLAQQIAAELEAALLRDGRASLSVPGGTTPGPVFDILCEAQIDWARVAVFLNDERWVDTASPRSNTRLLQERLMIKSASHASLIPLYANAAIPEDQLDALTLGLAPHLPISVLLLGMGADMHTASLFPGADQLELALSTDAPILLPMRADAAGEPRMTLSARVLCAARHIHIMVTGPEKRQAFERALTLPAILAPIRAVTQNATIHWAE